MSPQQTPEQMRIRELEYRVSGQWLLIVALLGVLLLGMCFYAQDVRRIINYRRTHICVETKQK